VVGFTVGSRGKVPGKTCENIAMMTIIIIIIRQGPASLIPKLQRDSVTPAHIFTAYFRYTNILLNMSIA
jgi:hypothetical protein